MFTFSFAVKTAAGRTRIVPIDVPKNCIKYAEKSLIDGCMQAGLGKPQIVPNMVGLIGENLAKMEEKQPGTRLRAVAEACAIDIYFRGYSMKGIH